MHYMHYKDYIHHDFYVYSPVLLTQYLGHCWHTPCTELYILRISAWLLRKPPSPATGGGGTIWLGEGGCGGPCSYIYIYVHLNLKHVKLRCTSYPCDPQSHPIPVPWPRKEVAERLRSSPFAHLRNITRGEKSVRLDVAKRMALKLVVECTPVVDGIETAEFNLHGGFHK